MAEHEADFESEATIRIIAFGTRDLACMTQLCIGIFQETVETGSNASGIRPNSIQIERRTTGLYFPCAILANGVQTEATSHKKSRS